MSERRPQLLKNPHNGSYPTIKGVHQEFKENDPRIMLPDREWDWSHVHKGQMAVVYLIAIIFATLIICSVF